MSPLPVVRLRSATTKTSLSSEVERGIGDQHAARQRAAAEDAAGRRGELDPRRRGAGVEPQVAGGVDDDGAAAERAGAGLAVRAEAGGRDRTAGEGADRIRAEIVAGLGVVSWMSRAELSPISRPRCRGDRDRRCIDENVVAGLTACRAGGGAGVTIGCATAGRGDRRRTARSRRRSAGRGGQRSGVDEPAGDQGDGRASGRRR